jgi:hypothetical protein
MDKRTLTEQFFIIDFIPEILPLDHKVLTKEAIITRSLGKNKSKEEWDYKHEYYEVTNHPHITWVKDYIRDHYNEKYRKTLVEIDQSYIVQLNKEGLKKHNYMHEYEYTKTPDISCLYCVATGPKTSYIIFEYKGGRIRNGKWKIPVEERKLVLFSSQMDHYITKNENKDAIINLSFQYQLV